MTRNRKLASFADIRSEAIQSASLALVKRKSWKEGIAGHSGTETAQDERRMKPIEYNFARRSIKYAPSTFEGVTGYLTPASMKHILSFLRRFCHLDSPKAVFCDIGCGEARPMTMVLENFPALGGAIGFDNEQSTLLLAKLHLDRLVALVQSRVPPWCLLQRDLTRLTCLGRTSHAYCFCAGMPADVQAHLLRVCVATPSLRYAVFVHHMGDFMKHFVQELHEQDRHVFRDANNRSQLRMDGMTVRGACVLMSPHVRQKMREVCESYALVQPSQDLFVCFA